MNLIIRLSTNLNIVPEHPTRLSRKPLFRILEKPSLKVIVRSMSYLTAGSYLRNLLFVLMIWDSRPLRRLNIRPSTLRIQWRKNVCSIHRKVHKCPGKAKYYMYIVIIEKAKEFLLNCIAFRALQNRVNILLRQAVH